MTSNGPSPPFQIGMSAKVADQIKAIAQQADALGQKQPYLEALRIIERRLRENPFDFGECRFHWSNIDSRCHIGAVRPVAVQFAIHEIQPVVLLLRVFLLGS